MNRTTLGGLTLGLLVFLSTADVLAQCVVPCTDPMKACVCVVDPADAPITVIPFGSVQRQPARPGLTLNAGDLLVNARQDAVAELVCPGGSEVKLHGQFQAVVRPAAPGQDCVIDVLAGNADVLAAKPTQLDAGETSMGSATTQYGIRVRRTGDALNVECLVFEGEAQVRYATRWIRGLKDAAKSSWTRGRGDPVVAQVTETDIRATSGVYARSDLARLRLRGERPADPRAVLNELTTTYTQVMTRPRDPEARIRLAALQTNLKNSKQVLYHLQLAERDGPTTNDQKTNIAIMKYVALKQTGRTAEADVEIEKVKTLDLAQYERIRSLDPATIRADPRQFRAK